MGDSGNGATGWLFHIRRPDPEYGCNRAPTEELCAGAISPFRPWAAGSAGTKRMREQTASPAILRDAGSLARPYVDTIFDIMNSRSRQTLQALFRRPVPPNIRWGSIESLIRALGGEVSEGAGSRVRVQLNGRKAVFHRPHPKPETNRSTVRDVRDFLESAGVSP